MTWICLDCNWTGRHGELERGGLIYHCPICGSPDIDEDEPEPDPLDEHNADYVRDGLQAVRGQL